MKSFATLALGAALATMLPLGAWAGRLEDIQSAGVLRVGIALTGEPIGFRDAANEPAGYDVVVANHLAAALGVKLEITEVSGAARISMLQAGQIDVVVANLTATLERAKAIDFTIPYLKTGLKLLTRDGSGVRTLKDLAGKKVIVGRGTTGEMMVKREVPTAQLVYTETFAPQAILLLRQQRADAAIEDSSLIDFAAKQNPGLVSLPDSYTADAESLGVRKGDPEFLRYLDMFVSMYISSGGYQENYQHWFGTPGPALTSLW